MNDRRAFLKTACKPIVLATLGIPILEACSTDEDSSSGNIDTANNVVAPREPLIIDISNNTFINLQDVGG